MDDINLTSASSSPSSLLKPVCSPSTGLPAINNKQRNDSASVIQQSDVSSSRPALLAHDVLGPLLFEALDGFFFTINHNCELDFVSDNVGQYLKFSQEELAGRNLYCCVHPSDVSEFSKAWAKKDAGDPSTPTAVTDQQNGQPRGRTFLCRMRTNDESTPYITMVVSVALHRDSSGSDKTFLICIARRPPINELKDQPALLGFDQFSSRINLRYDIESLDASHIKCETVDMNFLGKNFRDYVFVNDIPLINRHFQETVENGESKSAVYRFCLHDDIYAFVNTQSKLFSNTTTGKSESIISTHTIVRLIDNPHDLHGNASTRLMKSIIISNRDLQKNKQQTSSSSSSSSNKIITTPPPPPPPPPTSTPPIGTQFALTMLGMHKNASNSLQQHVTSTLGTLIQVQNSLSTSSPVDKTQQQFSVPSPPRAVTQKSSTLDNVSSSDSVEFGSKRTAFSPSFNSVHSNHGSIPSPTTSFDLSFTSVSPSNDLSFLLPNCSPSTKRTLSPLQSIDPTSLLFSNQDIYTTSSSPRTTTPVPSLQSRNSTRLRKLLATKSPTSPSPKTHLNGFDEHAQAAESPTTTHVSPLPNDQPSPAKRRRNLSQTNGTLNNSADILLKQILGRQAPVTTMTSLPNASSDGLGQENHSGWPSPASVPLIKTESNNSDDNVSGGQTSNASGGTNKLRSDIFLRTLLNDEVRPQKVVVEAPFAYNSRHKYNQRASAGSNHFLAMSHNRSLENLNARSSFKSQLSLQTGNSFDWDPRNKKKQRQHSHTFGARPNVMTTIPSPRRPGRPKRDPTDYLLSNPQSTLSENSLDSLLESSATNLDQSSPIALRRTTRQTSASNSKRTIDNEDPLSNPRKYPKLLTQALKDDIKIECTDHSIISPSVALAATRPLIQSSQPTIKTEPETPFLFDKTPSPSLKRTVNHMPSSTSQSTLLRSLIRTPHTPSITTKKDAPLYDLLQNLDSNDTSIFSSLNSTSSSSSSKPTDKHSIDPLEQYLTPALSQSTPASKTTSSKDNYLAALLSADPQQPNEISFVPNSNQQQQQQHPTLTRSSSTSSDNSRIAAIVNDLFASTATATATNSSTDDFLSLLDNKDFLECISDPTTIDSILSQNSTSVMETSVPSTTPKRSEKDEKAISEIYRTLVTSFNPGSSSLDLPVDHSPFSSITGDFLFAENSTMSLPPNRTAPADPSMLMYRQQQQQSTTYSYQNAQQQQSSNSSQLTDCLAIDMIDNNTFPPNVSLSPMNNSYLTSSTMSATHMETNTMMMHTQQPPTHIQHHQPQNQISNLFYRQSTQNQQQTMYNNYVQPPPNQVAPNYYPMQQQQQQQQQRMPPTHHPSQLNKRQALMHQQRTPQQTNQPLQLHMSMNVTLPHMSQNQQQLLPQQSQRPMMNAYNDLLMPNGNSPTLQQDFHRYSPANSTNNNPLDLPYNHDLFLSSSPSSGPSPSQQLSQNRHMTVMQAQQQPSIPSSQAAMHQSYSNMSVALSATIQQNPNNPNNLMNSSGPNLTPAECRQSDELNNQMMNCLSFPPTRFTSEFVRKQLQNTIHGRQKPAGGKDIPAATGQKMINSATLDANQKGAYFRSQLSSPMSTPPLQTNIRSQQQPGKTSM